MSYKKIQAGHPSYIRVITDRSAGLWACDAVDHNETSGCSNPECAKWNKAPECTCGGREPQFHPHTDTCAHGKWLLTLGWYKTTVVMMNNAFSSVFQKP